MASFLLFLKGSDGLTKPLGLSSGCILDLGNVSKYDLSNDKTALKSHIGKMTIDSIKTTCDALGVGISFKGGRPRKEHYVEALVKHWESIEEKAKTLATIAPTSSSSAYPTAGDETVSVSKGEPSSSKDDETETSSLLDDETEASPELQWTEQDEKRLDTMRWLNPPNSGVCINPDELWALEDKKRQCQLNALAVMGETININEEGDNTKPMMMSVPTLNSNVKVVFHFDVGMTGLDLFKALDDFGISKSLFDIKFANGMSKLQGYDSLEAYEQHDFQITPMLRGGGKRAKNEDTSKEKMSLKDLEREIAGVKLLLTNPSSEAVQNIIDRCEFIVARAKANPKNVCDDLIGHLDIATLTTLASGTMNAGTKISDRVSFVIENSMVAEMDKLHEMERQKEVSKKLLEHSVRFAIMTQFADGNNIQWASLVKFMTEKIGSHRPANAGDDRRGCIIG